MWQVIGRVVATGGFGLKLRLAGGFAGTVALCDIHDTYVANALAGDGLLCLGAILACFEIVPLLSVGCGCHPQSRWKMHVWQCHNSICTLQTGCAPQQTPSGLHCHRYERRCCALQLHAGKPHEAYACQFSHD